MPLPANGAQTRKNTKIKMAVTDTAEAGVRYTGCTAANLGESPARLRANSMRAAADRPPMMPEKQLMAAARSRIMARRGEAKRSARSSRGA